MSSRPNKAAIQAALSEWTTQTLKAWKIDAQLAADLAPINERYEKQCAPFRNEAAEKLRPINDRRAQLAAEIEKQLRLGIDEEKGIVLLPQVSVAIGAKATVGIAEVEPVEGNREIDPRTFFNYVAEAKRDDGFWGCLKVQIGKAEKYLGAAIDALAKKPKTFKVKIFLPELEKKK